MSNFYWEQFPGDFAKDSIPHLISLDDNLVNVYVAQFKLTPTAVLGGWWVLFGQSTPIPYLLDVEVSSDTNIEITWGRMNSGDPGMTARNVWQLGRGGGSAAQNTFEADIHAAISIFATWGGAFISANQPYSLLRKGWFASALNTGFFVSTAAVAANVHCQMTFVEMLG